MASNQQELDGKEIEVSSLDNMEHHTTMCVNLFSRRNPTTDSALVDPPTDASRSFVVEIIGSQPSDAGPEPVQPAPQSTTWSPLFGEGMSPKLPDAAQREDAEPLLLRRRPRKNTGTTKVVQQWEGRVDEVGDDKFVATVYSMTGTFSQPENAEIPINMISKGDRQLLHPGSLFYMTVATRISAAGSVENSTWLKFARMPSTDDSDNQASWRKLLGLD